MKNMTKLPKKSLKECTKEVDDIISGKRKDFGAMVIRKWIIGRKTVEPMESIRLNLINEMFAKYNGKTTLEEVQKQVKKDLASANNLQ